MHKKPLILFLTDIYWPSKGGIEESIRSLASFMRDKYEIRIITHAKNMIRSGLINKTALLPCFKEYTDESGNRVIPLTPNTLQRISMIPFLLWHLPLIRRICAKKLFDRLYRFYRMAFKKKLLIFVKDADIVHNFSTGYLAILSNEICTETSIPIIQVPPIHFNRWGDTPMQLHAYCRSTTLICFTNALKQEIEKKIQNISARVVVNPPLPPLPPLPPKEMVPPDKPEIDRPFMLFLARRETHKGLEILIEAFKRINTSFYLIIAGPGKKINTPPPRCYDLGEVSESTKHWLLANCTIFCVPSFSESFGMVYTEAMAYSKPVIGLDIKPVNEIIINGLTGILVPPDNTDNLTQALSRMIQNEDIREQMGKEGGDRYRKYYSREHILSVIENEYNTLLKKN